MCHPPHPRRSAAKFLAFVAKSQFSGSLRFEHSSAQEKVTVRKKGRQEHIILGNHFGKEMRKLSSLFSQTHLWIRQRPKSVVIFLSCCVPQPQVDRYAVHHHWGRVVVESENYEKQLQWHVKNQHNFSAPSKHIRDFVVSPHSCFFLLQKCQVGWQDKQLDVGSEAVHQTLEGPFAPETIGIEICVNSSTQIGIPIRNKPSAKLSRF